MLRSDEFFKRRLYLMPFILNVLKMSYPLADRLLTFYLIGIRKLKPTTFKVERISEEHFDDLLEENKFKKDFLGDKKSWALLSINSLAALSISSSSWLRLFLLQDSAEEKRKAVNPVKIKLPKPGEVDETVMEEIDTDDFVIQCIAVSSDVKDFHLFVTDDVFYNIKQKLNVGNVPGAFDVMVNVQNEEYRPESARTAVVAAINGSFDVVANDLEDVLHEYFRKPKYLRKNDCFSVSLKKYAPHLAYNANYRHVQKLDFKVVDLVGKDNRRKNVSSLGCLIRKNSTDLYLDPPVPGYSIPVTSKYVRVSDDVSGYEIPICPYGLKKQFDQLRSSISPFLLFKDFRTKPIFLLSGAEGSGKKTVIASVAKFFGLHVLDVDCFDFYGAGPSVTEAKLEAVASRVKKLAPSLLVFDNAQLIGRDRDHNEDVRLVEAFRHRLDEIFNKKSEYPIFVVATTDLKPSDLLPSVSRMFLGTVSFDVPKAEEAYQILNWFVQESEKSCPEQVLRKTSEKTAGYVFRDLSLLVRHALRFRREERTSTGEALSQKHFDKGIEIMEAAYSDTIGAAKVPTVKWEDVGGLENLKEEIMMTLNLPLKHPELFASGLKRSGILFYGPPGTGKTLMAKAVATECNFNFLSVKGPELMNMYVGQSEKNVREVFERARDASPCIVFFDELDSLAPNRGKSGDSGGVTDRVVSQLLAEMDGLQENNKIFVIAATNRPDLVDPALLRPGRFDKMFYVGVCGDENSKLAVLKALTRKFKLSEDVRFEDLVKKIPGQVTGADIYSVCSNAWLAAARRNIEKINRGLEVSIPVDVASEDFELAASEFVPSLTGEDISYYQRLKSLER